AAPGHRRSSHYRGTSASRPVAARIPPAAAHFHTQRPAGNLRAPPRAPPPQGELPPRLAGQLPGRADGRVAERGSRAASAIVPLRPTQATRCPTRRSVRPVLGRLTNDRYRRVTGRRARPGLLSGTLVAICYLGQSWSVDAR